MSSMDKSITISILKAYNWAEGASGETFELSFYSVLSKALILQKKIKPPVSNNQLLINTSLKITYTPQESEILLRMTKIGDDLSSNFVNEFLIDLALLEERKIQYLPFDKNDKILEVVNGIQSRDDRKSEKSVIPSHKIDTFIQEKSDYLKNVSFQNGSTVWNDENIDNKKNFTEKLYALLQETRKLRQKIEKQKKSQLFENAGNYEEGHKNSQKLSFNADQIQNQRLLIKSNSENLLTIPRTFQKNPAKNQKQGAKDKKWSPICQYKLDLKSLLILDPKKLQQDEIKQDEDEVLRSKQEYFSAFKNNRHQFSAYLPNVNQSN